MISTVIFHHNTIHIYCALSAAIEANIIARGTVGFSGADLENLVNQAALKAAVDGKDMVTMKELEFAKDKILMGNIFLDCTVPSFFSTVIIKLCL